MGTEILNSCFNPLAETSSRPIGPIQHRTIQRNLCLRPTGNCQHNRRPQLGVLSNSQSPMFSTERRSDLQPSAFGVHQLYALLGEPGQALRRNLSLRQPLSCFAMLQRLQFCAPIKLLAHVVSFSRYGAQTERDVGSDRLHDKVGRYRRTPDRSGHIKTGERAVRRNEGRRKTGLISAEDVGM